MIDMFPYLKISGNTPEEQIKDIEEYLIHFKESLEFAITNISTENLSSDLQKRLSKIEADIEKSNANIEDEIAQIAKKGG